MITRHPDVLRDDIARVLRAAGADDRNVEIVADHLKGAELCGVQTHGIFQIPSYIEQIEKKELIPDAWPEVPSDAGNRATVTGNVGFGHAAADFSMRLAATKAREHGLAVVGLVRANHIGRLGHYAEIAAGAGDDLDDLGIGVLGDQRPRRPVRGPRPRPRHQPVLRRHPRRRGQAPGDRRLRHHPGLRGEGDERAAPRRRAASRDDRRQRGQADHRPRRLLRRRGAGPVRRPQGVRDHDRRRADGKGVRRGGRPRPSKGRGRR